MNIYVEILVGISYGIGIGAMAIYYAVVYTTLVPPPPQVKFNKAHAKVSLIRLFGIMPMILAIALARPIRLVIDSALIPVIALIFLFPVTIFGLQNVLPKFMKTAVYSEDLQN